ncbi:MAG: hypothetical protein M3Z24_14365 [Chloroflexota bacterium]|nr:hypothetical protein [Chloroflexota bacterium]
MRFIDNVFLPEWICPVDEIPWNDPTPIVVSVAAGGTKTTSQYQLHPLQMTGCLFRFQHENALTVIVLEIEVHSKGSDPYVVVVAGLHQDTWRYQPLISCETINSYRTYPADLAALDQLNHASHAWSRMNSECAAQCLIICDHLDMTGTAHVSEVFNEFVRLHFETVDIGFDLDKAGLSYIDDSIFIQRELIVGCQQVLVYLLLDNSAAHS